MSARRFSIARPSISLLQQPCYGMCRSARPSCLTLRSRGTLAVLAPLSYGVSHHPTTQVSNILGAASRWAVFLRAGGATFTLITHTHVRTWNHHPATSQRSRLRKASATVTPRLVLRVPASPVSWLSRRHVVHPVFVAVSVVKASQHINLRCLTLQWSATSRKRAAPHFGR